MNNDGVDNLTRICFKATQLEVGTFEPFMFLAADQLMDK
jgi:hypothetical protein